MKFFEFLEKAFCESNGRPSSSRILNLFIVVQWSVAATIGFFIVLAYYPQYIVEYFLTFAGLIAATLGAGVVRKKFEDQADRPNKIPPILPCILILFLFIGCGSSGVTQRTLVQDRIVKAPTPQIEETLPAVRHDTVIVAQKIVKNDTIIQVKYFPKTNTIYLNVKPDSVTILIHDTVQTMTGYTDNDLEAAKFTAYKWGIGSTIIFCAAVGLLLKLNHII